MSNIFTQRYIFTQPFPEDLVPVLEAYLRDWRPILLTNASQPSSHVFLTRYGTPFTQKSLRASTQAIVHPYTKNHWHPHIVRSVWATEWIRNPEHRGDFYTAAVMLNDTLEMVIKKYAHLLTENVTETADKIMHQRKSQST